VVEVGRVSVIGVGRIHRGKAILVEKRKATISKRCSCPLHVPRWENVLEKSSCVYTLGGTTEGKYIGSNRRSGSTEDNLGWKWGGKNLNGGTITRNGGGAELDRQ